MGEDKTFGRVRMELERVKVKMVGRGSRDGRDRGLASGAFAWRLEVELPHAGLSCVAPRLKCVAVAGLDWEKPNSPEMCVDPGVRLGGAQFSSGGVTEPPRLVNVKWVAPMDKCCMTMRPGVEVEGSVV
ncbi:hypothetical protein Bca52824_035208 [Brassica carinata]|uniref:Uncharacterized protein n=1 Tax=Brassica carinata TaxID=52824 RepID=A0A8X7S378_BRACI|nr:hypothetical protein Bca52824_035208 [Brassica carinata]